MDEFGLIARYFRPLSLGHDGALQLTDDAALLTPPPGCQLAVTKDAISAGVHFIGTEDPAWIAKKLLRVNLSDLAAMGATPLVYFLACILPKDTTEAWIARFTEGLREDQAEFAIHLAGGDTISTHGPLSLSITALGTVPSGHALKRNAAQPGDTIYVSGTLGDSTLGLAMLQAHKDGHDFLKHRYYFPQPRLALGQSLWGVANAAMDISDGLAQDLGHICRASGVGATLYRQQLPVSPQATTLLNADPNAWNAIISGGDDYELLFTVPPEKTPLIAPLSETLALPLTAIGHITEGKNIHMQDETGQSLDIPHKGFRHFS